MPDETIGPSLEEIGQKENEGSVDLSKEKVGKDFEAMVNSRETHPSFTEEVKEIDGDRLFAIIDTTALGGKHTSRTYYNYFLKDENQIGFEEIAEARLYPIKGVVFEKTGRPGKEFMTAEKEDLRVHLEEGYRELEYGVNNIKGDQPQKIGIGFNFGYDESGRIKNMGLVLPGESRELLPELLDTEEVDSRFFSTIEDFEAAARENRVIEIDNYSVTLGFEPGSNMFVARLSKNGEPKYMTRFPKSLDINNISDELGVEELLKNPYQPSEGVKGKSVGDQDWRYKSFSDLTGIKITPIDTEESIPGLK